MNANNGVAASPDAVIARPVLVRARRPACRHLASESECVAALNLPGAQAVRVRVDANTVASNDEVRSAGAAASPADRRLASAGPR